MNRLEKLAKETARVYDESLEAVRNTVITCEKCGKNGRLRSWTYYYVDTSGMMSSWNFGVRSFVDGPYNDYIKCPGCGHTQDPSEGPRGEVALKLIKDHGFSSDELFDHEESTEVRQGVPVRTRGGW